jgi:hypothetical protein
VGESARGSTAFTGAVDIVLQLKRHTGPRPTLRALAALSRFNDTPEEVIIDLTPAGYVSLGDTEAVAEAEARAAILDILPAAPVVGLTMDELVGPERPRSTVQRVIDTDPRVERTGAGKRGDPYRYRLRGGGY